MTSKLYERDIVAWAKQQAHALRAGLFDQLDLQHLAEEIEDVGKSEQRELIHRLAILIGHLLKWCYQPTRRGASWESTIRTQRAAIARRLRRTPSLKHTLADPDWFADAWSDGRDLAVGETGLTDLPENCPWSLETMLTPDWLPDEIKVLTDAET
ncbi:DUF29 domain-containing protein [Thiorhodospira sibirica]|uniref:DUF29 domain-containing protein n=1 Tax=Thiorhodospira sibirica TaxID=154347 RepID=UPI00022C52A0|nr:DUF29 domain-containing protein [Thiorhodospira sibirica]